MQKINVGDIFDKLTVVEVYQFPVAFTLSNGKIYYKHFCKCKCSCGRYTDIRVEKLFLYKNKGKSNHCKACAYRTRPQSTRRFPPEKRLYNLSVRNRCRKSKGRILNNLTLEDFIELISQDCYYCGEPPERKDYIRDNKFAKSEVCYANGLDRVDNKGHYEKENLVPCCKFCNSAKGEMSQKDFLDHIRKIYKKTLEKK